MHTIEGAWDLARPRPARDPHGAWVTATYRLGPTHPCRHCGRVVRQAWWKGGRPECLLFVEGPIDPAGVSQRWMAWWWDDARPLQDRVARHDPEHLARGDLLFVMHPCEDPAYRPPPAVTASTAPPTREAPPRMTAPFGTPKATGDMVDQHAIKNRLLLVNVTEIVRGMVTKATKPGETTDAVRCDIVALDNGDEHANALLFGKMLVGAFEAGTMYLGRITKVDGKVDGRDQPWLFTGAQDDPAAVQTAQQYLAYKATRSLGQPPSAAPAPAAAPPAAAPAPAFPPAAAQAASPTPPAAPPWAA